ncbi:DUF3857 domain-containing protein [Gracilimonas tropica]|uniref:DUF3857 domain-containing protein n=1 Tax=Gracilimonas tropica TaxID=454600 RepID=UPI00036D1F65|nr:DUF3857 domain-containing protein [Gracilimonas tropica]
MYKVNFLILGVILLLGGCASESNLFEVKSQYVTPVPAILQLGAYSTIRTQDAVLSYYGKEKAEYKEHGIITILDEKHKNQGVFELYYDRFRELEYLNVQVVNSNGMIVGSYRIDDADDYSASGENFYSDVRVKVLSAYHYSYPFTIEYEYKYSYSGTLNLPGWYPKSYGQSVENASFTIRDYSKGGMRYHSRNLEQAPVISEYPDRSEIAWNLTMQLAQKGELYSPPYSEVFPNVITSASNFKIENSEGDASSWEKFGKWYFELGKDKRKLPDKAKNEIDQLIAGINDEREKVEVLYQYMQDMTRYVSIQLGLGGWEPYSAEFVYHNKYGDCKALVNFMQAILEYAGIDSEQALIRLGLETPSVIENFPSSQFNHVILKVDTKEGETIWLECTSKYMQPGRVGAGNEGKFALLVNNNGGKLVKTRLSASLDNTASRKAIIELQDNGTAFIQTYLRNSGSMNDEMLHRLKPISKKQRKEWFNKTIPLNDFDVTSLKFHGLSDKTENTGYDAELVSGSFASGTSKRLFVPVNKFNPLQVYVPDDEFRMTSIELRYLFMEVDTTIFKIPSGYITESLPKDVHLETDFGMFSLELEERSGEIYVSRKLKIDQKEIPKQDYEEFRHFFTSVKKADQDQFVLVKE